MDEFNLNLKGRFMKGIIAKFIRKAIQKQAGCEIDLLLNNVSIKNDGGKMTIHIDADAEITNEEFTKLIKKIL